MSDADRAAAAAWHDYMDRVRSDEITLDEANRLADSDPVITPRSRDLDRHGLAWRLRGFPVFDDEGDEIVGVVSAELRPWADLTADQQSTVKALVDELVAGGASEDVAWGWACDQFGVTCNHRWEYHEPTHRDCPRCNVFEELPGVVVWLGDQRVRVPDPPPATWRVARPVAPTVAYVSSAGADLTSLEVDEYRWDGRRYVLAPR